MKLVARRTAAASSFLLLAAIPALSFAQTAPSPSDAPAPTTAPTPPPSDTTAAPAPAPTATATVEVPPPPPPAPVNPHPAAAPAAQNSSSALTVQLASLESLRQRGVISQAAYDSAVRDLTSTTGARAGDANTLMLGRFSTTMYGFIEADSIFDSTESFNDLAGNGQVARSSGYAGSHPRVTFGVRNSRIGFRIAAPEFAGIRASGLLEMDFLGNQPPTATEAQLFTSPAFRIRHFALKVETPVVDLLIGQTWQLFGWQSAYHPNTVEIQGVPGQIYSRTPQIRVSRTFHSDAVNLEIAVAAMRPPQRDSATPEGQAGVRLAVNHWTGLQTTGATGTSVAPFSIAVTGDVRRFSLPQFSAMADPHASTDTVGWGFAADAFIPVIPARNTHSAGLSLTGEFAYGYGTADLYTGLSGGLSFPTLPNPDMITPAPTYTPNVDNGLVTFTADGVLHAIQWTSVIAGAQFYLPGCDGRLWLSANYSHMVSNNSDQLGAGAKVRKAEDWADVNVFGDITPAFRLGLEYAVFVDQYAGASSMTANDAVATNHRVQLSAFYRF